MGRLFGILQPRIVKEDLYKTFEYLASTFPDINEGSFEKYIKPQKGIAIGLSNNYEAYYGRIGVSEDQNYVAAFCGFFPDLDETFDNYGLHEEINSVEKMISLYKQKGEKIFSILRGMFMIVIVDYIEKRLLVANDRHGLFPIYFSNEADGFVFSSSIKIIKNKIKNLVINSSALVEHLLFDALYGGLTYYSNIELLGYGNYLIYDMENQKISRHKYFRYEELFHIDKYEKNKNIDAVYHLNQLLKNALTRIFHHNNKDDFGIFCGGGIDCSYVAALIKEINGGVPIFTTYLTEGPVSEDKMARDIADHLGLKIFLAKLTPNDYYPLLLKSIIDYDQPIVHPNMVKSYVISKLAVEKEKRMQVLGVASDLLFGGFSNVSSLYKYIRIRKYLGLLPKRIRRILMMSLDDIETVDLKLRMRNPLSLVSSLGMGNFERANTRQSIINALACIKDPNEKLLKTLMLENLCDYQEHLMNRRYELKSSNTVALFFPFLDLDVLKFAINLPTKYCVGLKKSKIIIRNAAIPYLGSKLSSRKKWGGDVPIEKWIRPLTFMLKNGFLEEFFRFNYNELDPILNSNSKLCWNLIDIELWGRLCVWGQTPFEIMKMFETNGIKGNYEQFSDI